MVGKKKCILSVISHQFIFSKAEIKMRKCPFPHIKSSLIALRVQLGFLLIFRWGPDLLGSFSDVLWEGGDGGAEQRGVVV